MSFKASMAVAMLQQQEEINTRSHAETPNFQGLLPPSEKNPNFQWPAHAASAPSPNSISGHAISCSFHSDTVASTSFSQTPSPLQLDLQPLFSFLGCSPHTGHSSKSLPTAPPKRARPSCHQHTDRHFCFRICKLTSSSVPLQAGSSMRTGCFQSPHSCAWDVGPQ